MKLTFFLSLCLFCQAVMAQVPKIHFVQFATGFTKPLDIKHCGDDRLFIVEQAGRIRILRPNGSIDANPFMNITPKVNSAGNEQGLLSMAFSPNYKTDGYFFVCYIKGSGNGNSVIARYSVNPLDSNLADTATEKIILQFPQPYSNHNGCDLRFGPDGYLYATFGDGGSAGDPQGYAQNTNSLLGKILRIDPFTGINYTIPSDNPFFGQAGKRGEIWSYGWRNPWRCSFDRLTGDYWAGDVGQNVYEEIHFQPASSTGGENYGWRCYEGNATYNMSGCSTNPTDYVFPVHTYTHSASSGCSVTGGFVYRGPQYKNMFGKYIFADYCSGRVWSIEKNGTTFTSTIIGNYLTYQYSSFGENEQGDLFVSGLGNGRIYRVTDTSSCQPVAFLGFADTVRGCGASATLNTLPGTGLTYAWSVNGSTIPAANSHTYTATQNGIYVVAVTNTATCTARDTVVVLLNQATPVNITGIPPYYCVTHPSDSLIASVPGGVFTLNDTLVVTHIDPGALGTGTFVIKYTYTNSYGCVSTDTVHAVVSLCTGVNEAEGSVHSFSISPNPGSGWFDLILDAKGNAIVPLSVQNLMGAEVHHEKLSVYKGKSSHRLDLRHLPVGIYLIRTGNNADAPVRKVQIVK